MALSDGVRSRRPPRRAPVIAPIVIAFRHASRRGRTAVLAVVVLVSAATVAVARTADGSGPSSVGGAFCTALRGAVSQTSLATLAADDPHVRRRGYVRFDDALATLTSAAPASRRGDVVVVRDAYASVSERLAAVGFRAERVEPSMLAPLSTRRFRAASARLHAHASGVCGLPATRRPLGR